MPQIEVDGLRSDAVTALYSHPSSSEPFYATSLEHILAELERIDLLVQCQVARARHLQPAADPYQGLCITEQEVDALLARPRGAPRWTTADSPCCEDGVRQAHERLTNDNRLRRAESARRRIVLRLDELARLFHLAPFDVDALLVALAPELELRYQRLYAYLQDDVTKRHPSVNLVLDLLCSSFEAKITARSHFAPSAPLLKHHLLHIFDDPSHPHPPLLSRYLKVDERIVNYLLGSNEPDCRLLPFVRDLGAATRLEELVLPEDVKKRLRRIAQAQATRQDGVILYFQGPYGVGKRTTAQALCEELGMTLLVIDGELLMNPKELDFQTALRLAIRESLLQKAALYWTGFDVLLADDKRDQRTALLEALAERRGTVFLAGDLRWEPQDALHDRLFVRVEFARPGYEDRRRLWIGHLDQGVEPQAEPLANAFRFTAGQIQDAAATARNLARWRDPENAQLSRDDLYRACRLQSNSKLAALARPITPHYSWDDIVLPADELAQLREICHQASARHIVYGEWGFDRKLSLGKGLNVLFTGPPGTGKTMAAEVIANQLGLDLYKIDLSQVVSKYIGETEKNLDRIFTAAQSANAILFFDEADALFGKRSEVKDAHDRYANIEVGYLLQKMEEYEGLAILATNLRSHMDEAFVRRIHFIVELPFPDEHYRRRIWEVIFPREAPLGEDVDFGLLARGVKLAGGNIKNIGLAAAFYAAGDGGVIRMPHLLQAARREHQKLGRVWNEAR